MSNWEDKLVKGEYIKGLQTYTLLKNAILYHGTMSTVTSENIKERSNFFADKCTAYQYCVLCYKDDPNSIPNLYKYKVVEPITGLIAMDSCANINILAQLKLINTEALEESWQSCDGKRTVPVRSSVSEHDKIIYSAICKLKIKTNGYASKELKDIDNDDFPGEIFICDPMKYLKFEMSLQTGYCRKRKR